MKRLLSESNEVKYEQFFREIIVKKQLISEIKNGNFNIMININFKRNNNENN